MLLYASEFNFRHCIMDRSEVHPLPITMVRMEHKYLFQFLDLPPLYHSDKQDKYTATSIFDTKCGQQNQTFTTF